MGPLASDVIIKPENGTSIKTSLSNLTLTDTTTSTQVISTVADPLIDFGLQIYKVPSADNADIEVTATVNRIQAAVMFTFIKRLLSFVKSMNVKKELVESAKEATNEQAKKAIETAKKARSKRIKLDITVDAPVVSLLLTSGASFMVDLGILQLSNKFEPALKHYSNTGDELVDVMSLSLKDLQVVRRFDKGSHTIISPVTLKGGIIRTLEALNTDIPNVAIEFNIDSIGISFNPGDYNEVFNVLKELPTSSSTNEESADTRNVKSLSKTGPTADPSSSSSSGSNGDSPSDFKLNFKMSIGSLGLSVESDSKQTEIVSIKLTSLESSLGLDHSYIRIGFLIKSLEIADPLSSSFPLILTSSSSHYALVTALERNDCRALFSIVPLCSDGGIVCSYQPTGVTGYPIVACPCGFWAGHVGACCFACWAAYAATARARVPL
uniref:Uncharacterized protein n=1 Tax=Amphimedon queenslandica TaxID=400682 RepID=A0A1X7T657_AMPQE